MKFKCVFVNKRTNKIINKDFTVAQIDKYMGEYIKDRAIKRGHTTTTERPYTTSFRFNINPRIKDLRCIIA